MSEKSPSKVKGGIARAKKLSSEERSAIAKKAALARWNTDTPVATHESTIKLGDLDIDCAVLEDGTRVISERAMTRAFGGKRGGSHWKRMKEDGSRLPVYISAKNYLPYITKDLESSLSSPIKYKTKQGGIANGLDAGMLPAICDIFLKTRDAQSLYASQMPMAVQADIIMRALASVGIIALIDEATGYQRDRASDALAQILEKFIAKELQPWVKTFPDEFYEEMFRLRKLNFPKDTVKKPQYFGHLTNDIIYKRLAPGILEELKKSTPKNKSGARKHQLQRRLSPDLGHPKLKERLASVTTIMKLSENYDDFKVKLNKIHPRLDSIIIDDNLSFDFGDLEKSGVGL